MQETWEVFWSVITSFSLWELKIGLISGSGFYRQLQFDHFMCTFCAHRWAGILSSTQLWMPIDLQYYNALCSANEYIHSLKTQCEITLFPQQIRSRLLWRRRGPQRTMVNSPLPPHLEFLGTMCYVHSNGSNVQNNLNYTLTLPRTECSIHLRSAMQVLLLDLNRRALLGFLSCGTEQDLHTNETPSKPGWLFWILGEQLTMNPKHLLTLTAYLWVISLLYLNCCYIPVHSDFPLLCK